MASAISWFYVIVFEIIWPLPDTIVTNVPVLFGPVVAGFVMTALVSGREGVRQLLHRLVLWRLRPPLDLFPLLVLPPPYVLRLALGPRAFSPVRPPLPP